MIKFLISKYNKWKLLKNKKETIEEYLVSEGYVIHQSTENTTTYFNNIVVVQVIKNIECGGLVIFIGDNRFVDISFIPDVMFLKYIIKNYVKKEAELYY